MGNTCPPGGCACRSAMLENVLIKELPRPKQAKGFTARAPTGSQGRREGDPLIH